MIDTLQLLLTEPPGTIVVVAGPHNGDATWATPHFKALKEKHPNQRLVVCCPAGIADIFHHNPHIDRLLIAVAKNGGLRHLTTQASETKRFSVVVPPISIWPIANSYNLLRTQQYLSRRGYSCPNLRPDLYISASEIDHCNDFINRYTGGPKLMIECFTYSKQSAFGVEWLKLVADYVLKKHPSAWLFVPCNSKEYESVPFQSRIVPLQQFTIRQCGFLINSCDYFLSCSSGVSHACSSTLVTKEPKWLETITDEWHSTMAYGIAGRQFHIGDSWNDYFNMLQLII